LSPNLLADLHISPKTVETLRQAGYAISRVTDHLPPIASDRQILQLAERLEATILTQDLDFSALVAKSGKTFPSVVSLRVGNASPQRVSRLLLTLLPTVEGELQEGAIISVDDEGVRIRLLPIK
jgi:predicted nuclease of predicted toxin-antitoxin system